MADIKTKYGSSGQAITVTLASLANQTARESAAIDNSSNLFLGALVQLGIKTGASVSGDKCVYVYAYGSADGGGIYSGNASGQDAIFGGNINNLKLMGVIDTPKAATTYESHPMNVANAFGGIMPEKWGIVIYNKTGNALDSSEASFTKVYQGVWAQSV